MWFEIYKYPRYIDHKLNVDFPFFSAVDRSGEVERFCDWGIVTPWKLNYIVIWITSNEFLFVLQSTCINMITVITKVSSIFKELIVERTWFLLAVWRQTVKNYIVTELWFHDCQVQNVPVDFIYIVSKTCDHTSYIMWLVLSRATFRDHFVLCLSENNTFW